MLKRLIINADDFGLSEGTNLAIVEACLKGAVNSASLMANTPGFQQAVELARSHPGLDIGVHFALTQGRPVAAPKDVPSLVDGGGRLLTRRRLLVRSLLGRVQYQDVERELHIQVERILAAGIRPSHINGTQHTHIFPVVRDVVLKAAQDLGAAVRVPSERLVFRGLPSAAAVPLELPTIAAKAGLRGLARSFRRMSRRAGVPANDHLVSTFGFLPRRGFFVQDLVRLVDTLDGGVTELMVHPAHSDPGVLALWGTRRLARERELELRALVDDRFTDALKAGGIVVTTYASLCSPR